MSELFHFFVSLCTTIKEFMTSQVLADTLTLMGATMWAIVQIIVSNPLLLVLVLLSLIGWTIPKIRHRR